MADRHVQVLAVDDLQPILNSYRRLLTRLDVTFELAADGQEALTLVDQGLRFDFLLTDYSMPGLDGGRLIRELRARGCEQPMVVATGDDGLTVDDIPGATAVGGKIDSPQMLTDLLRRHGIL